MDKVLKACPFCGRQVVSADVSGGGPKYWIDCYQCEAVGPVTDGYDNIKQSWNRRPIEDALRAERDAAVARAEAAEAALLKARSAGARAEREAVIKHIRTHPDVADRRGGQHVGTGPNPSVQRFMLRILIPDLECGAHVPEPS